jgi:predicted DNA-binding transcriptional regulator YafY
VQLVEGYRTRLTGMTADEAEALFLSGLPGPAAELGLGTVMTAAQLKVMAALPGELRARASRLVERFFLDAGGWFHGSEQVPYLSVLAEAVWESRRVTITYQRGDSRVERLVEPLGLVLKAGTWYVVAANDDQLRTYRVSRVVDAQPSDERFTRPSAFDLGAYWTESSAAYEREIPRLTMRIRVAPDRVHGLGDFIGGGAAARARVLDEPDPEGWTRLEVKVDWPDEAPGRLLGLGGDVEILDPPDARETLIALASGALARNAPPARRMALSPTGRRADPPAGDPNASG